MPETIDAPPPPEKPQEEEKKEEEPMENGLEKKEGEEGKEETAVKPASVKGRIVKRREREFFVKWKYR